MFNNYEQKQLILLLKVKSESEVAQSRPTLCDPMDWSLPKPLHPWNFPGKSTGVGCHFLLQVLEGLVGLHGTVNFIFSGISGWDIELDYCDVECFALETNQDHSVIFDIAAKYCILDCFVD